jgi:transposase-like protein
MNEALSTQVLKVDGAGRVRTPREKREQIVEAYESSGMTGRQFAEYCGVRYSTLMSWAKRHGKTGGMPRRNDLAGGGWVEALIEEPKEGALELSVGSIVRMQVGSMRQAELAGAVLRSLGLTGSC